ncbi:MAG: MMPL family transporter [Deltaproteobacteria bacterium]|jgi:predicted RND superfamily exporter protein|nr:MMPL family transporter [Deltaproteobacteria bacterium]
MKHLEVSIGYWVIKYRWWLIAATLLISAAAAGGMRYLTFDNDLRAFFSEENPQLQALEALENTYNKIDNVYFTIAPKDGNVFTRETLAAIEELTESAWQIPYSSRVDSITNFQHTRSEDDELIVEDLVTDALNLSDEALQRIRETALSEPRLVNQQISPSGHVTGLNVNILPPGNSKDAVPEIAAYVRKMVDDFQRKHPRIDIYLAGAIMFDNAFSEATRDDMKTLIPVMFAVLVTVIGLALRSYTGTVATLIIILLSMVTGMGLAGWLGIALTPASGIAPTIILTLAVADSVHIMATVYQQMSLGRPKQDAVAESLRLNLQPVFLTSITTAIGFLTMNFSDAPPFRDLGNIVAMGVVAAFFYSIFFLPSMLVILPIKVRKITATGGKFCHACDRLADFVIRRRQPIFWIMAVLVVTLVSGMAKLELNDNFLKYFSKKYDIRRATDFMQENLRGWDIIEYSLDSGEPGGIHEPAFLNKVEEFALWYSKQPKVTFVSTLTDTIKTLNKNMHGDDPAYYRIPESRELAAQYLLLYELSLPFGQDLNNRINVDKSSTRMIVFLEHTTAKDQRQMDAKAREWLKNNAPPHMFTYGSGLSIIWAHISKRNIESMLGASFGALVLISAILIFALRSFRIGIISLLPNLAPAFMAFGIWGILVGQVGLGLSVIVSLTIGIVVDDTIHFLSKYLRARREENAEPTTAVRYAFNTVGTAMWVTTLALVAGFSVLTASGYNINAQMGLLSAITISLALLLDFFFLPSLLMKIDGKDIK